MPSIGVISNSKHLVERSAAVRNVKAKGRTKGAIQERKLGQTDWVLVFRGFMAYIVYLAIGCLWLCVLSPLKLTVVDAVQKTAKYKSD